VFGDEGVLALLSDSKMPEIDFYLQIRTRRLVNPLQILKAKS